MKSNEIDWSTFLIDDGLSLEEERTHSLAMSEYLLKTNHSNDVTDRDKVILHVDLKKIELKHQNNFKLSKSSNELFDLFSETDYELSNPQNYFPKVKKIDESFLFLLSLSELVDSHTHILFENVNENYHPHIELMKYLNFIDAQNKDIYLITPHLTKLANLNLENKYLVFLTRIASSQALNNIIKLQLSTNSFDLINKSIVREDLLKDRSVIEEQLTVKDLEVIIKNMRSWYLSIRSKLQS